MTAAPSPPGQRPAGPHPEGADGAVAATPDPAARRRMVWVIAGAVALAAVATGLWVGVPLLRYSLSHVTTDDAFLEGRVVQVTPRISGPVIDLLVDDNQHVAAGDLLFRIDPADYRLALEQATAALETARAQREQAEHQVPAAEANVSSAQAEVKSAAAQADFAQRELERLEQAGQRGAATPEEIDQARTQARSAAATLATAGGRFDAAEAQRRVTQAAAASAARAERQAQVAVETAQLNLSYTEVRAPFSGSVARRAIEPGSYLAAGQAAMAIVSDELWVVANFKETQLDRLRVGQPVTIRVDAYPGLRLSGRVDSFQRGTGSRFSLLPPENATGNYVKVVQRVPVKITFEPLQKGQGEDYVLGAGMSVVPYVEVR